MVPGAVEDMSGVDRGVALDVTADVEAEGKDRSVVLEREEDALLAVLFAEYLSVAAQFGGGYPGAEREGGEFIEVGFAFDAQEMIAVEIQGVAEQARGALGQGRAGGGGHMAVAGGIAAVGAGGFVEVPVGDERFVDGQRRSGCGFCLGGRGKRR